VTAVLMRRFTLLAALTFAAGAGAIAGCSTGDDPGPAIAVEPSVIYARNCARCHGLDGRGDPEIKKTMPNVRDFHDREFLARANTDSIVNVVMAGKGQMPAFARSLSMPKMQSLSGYVRRLGTSNAPPGGAP
jgi:cytochrome c oxidase cbb3-type subunit 3